tara:strand:+ start:10524 stop:10664 length:141 start_codon:yes stop_codon:yes gene_type:complete
MFYYIPKKFAMLFMDIAATPLLPAINIETIDCQFADATVIVPPCRT